MNNIVIRYTPSNDVLVLYRDGEGKKLRPNYSIFDGVILVPDDIEKFCNFLGLNRQYLKVVTKSRDSINVKLENLYICFDENTLSIIFFKDKKLCRGYKSKLVKKKSKWFNQLFEDYYCSKQLPCVINYWDIKSDFVKAKCTINDLQFELIPEFFDEDKPLYNYIRDNSLQGAFVKLNEHCPYDLNNNYDYSDKMKNKMKKIEEMKLKGDNEFYHKNYEDACCEICGDPNADYVVDPYDEDIHGITNMRYLCGDCYYELCMDI